MRGGCAGRGRHWGWGSTPSGSGRSRRSSEAGGVRRAVQSLGLWIYPVGIGTIALLVGCGVPRLLLCTVAGMTLGFWRGLLLGELGTVVGYYGVFLFIRWGGREWALHRWPKLQKWADLVRGQGILGVILLRQI